MEFFLFLLSIFSPVYSIIIIFFCVLLSAMATTLCTETCTLFRRCICYIKKYKKKTIMQTLLLLLLICWTYKFWENYHSSCTSLEAWMSTMCYRITQPSWCWAELTNICPEKKCCGRFGKLGRYTAGLVCWILYPITYYESSGLKKFEGHHAQEKKHWCASPSFERLSVCQWFPGSHVQLKEKCWSPSLDSTSLQWLPLRQWLPGSNDQPEEKWGSPTQDRDGRRRGYSTSGQDGFQEEPWMSQVNTQGEVTSQLCWTNESNLIALI